MTDFVHAIPHSSTLFPQILPQQIAPVGTQTPGSVPQAQSTPVPQMTSGSVPQVTTNYQPTGNKPLSGGRAAIAVILVFVFAGAMFYDRYQQRIDAFFGESGKRPVVVKARPPAKMSKLDQAEGRPTREPPLPTIIKSNQPPQLYFGQ